MKKMLLGSALATLMVMGAPLVALAHEDAQTNAGAGLNLGSVIHADVNGNANVNANAHVDGNKGKDNDNDADDATTTASSTPRGEHNGNPIAKFGGSVAAGTVSVINGSVITLSNLFGGGTTTVDTNASTTFVGHGHQATTSAALMAGQKVVVFGQSVGGVIQATFVKILNGFGHFHFWFGAKANANASTH